MASRPGWQVIKPGTGMRNEMERNVGSGTRLVAANSRSVRVRVRF